jgi:hypothetical protein
MPRARFKRKLLSQAGYLDCPSCIKVSAQALCGDERARLQDVLKKPKVSAMITGSEATLFYDLKGYLVPISLVKVDGTWYNTDLGG